MPASSSRSTTTSSTRAASWTCGCARRACSNTAPAPARTSRALRGEGERLSGGGKSSGLMSFLKIGDRAAGAIKSGGTTRRAAKMVIVDIDHPDIEEFIDWKVKEEQKVAALVTGSKINQKHLKAILKACVNCEGSGDDCFEPEKNPALKREIKLARRSHVPDNYIQRVIQFAKQGYTDIDFPIYDTDWDSRGLSHRLRPELQQLGARHRRVPQGGRSRRRLGPDLAHQARQGRQDAEGARPVGEDRPRRLGLRRSGPAVPHHHQRLAHLPGVGPDPRLAIRARNTCSSTTRPAISPRSTCSPFRDDEDRAVRRRGLRARRPAVDHRARNLGDDGAVPVEGDRAALLRVPHARPRLRQHRRPADVVRHPLRLRRRPRDLRRAHRDHDRRLLCDLGRDGGGARPLPGLREEPRAHAARHAQPSPRRVRRERPATRSSRTAAGAARPRHARRRTQRSSPASPRTPSAPGTRRSTLGEAARLPQRAGDRDRADRHDRPRHGLRHHRHRARLRAGEVQEARRRRLLQDHQPRRAGGAARARLLARARSPRSRSMRSATARSARRPASTTRRCKAKGFTDEAIAKVEKALPTAFDIKFAFNKWTLGEDFLRDTARRRRPRRSPRRRSTCSRTSASPSARSRPPTSTSAAR